MAFFSGLTASTAAKLLKPFNMRPHTLRPHTLRPHTPHVRGGSVSRRGLTQPAQRRAQLAGAACPKEESTRTPAALRERGVWGERGFSQRSRLSPQNLRHPPPPAFREGARGRGPFTERPQTAEKRHVFKRGYDVLAYSKEIKQEKIALTIRFIFWTAAVRKDCSYMLRIPSMRA